MEKVLIACEESQAVTIEFRKLGFEAYSCDIEEPSGGHPEWHIQGNVLPLLNGNCSFITMDDKCHSIKGHWDLIIGFPPCTYLTNGGAVRMFLEKTQGDRAVISLDRLKNMIKGRDLFMAIKHATCEHIAIENPTPMTICVLPPPRRLFNHMSTDIRLLNVHAYG